MFEPKTLYRNYSAKGSSEKDIIARKHQRRGWVIKYQRDGSCKSQLVDAGILPRDNTLITKG